MKPHTFHPEAVEEYAEAARYYATIDPNLAGRFYDEIEGLILDVRKHPDRFWEFDPPVRRHLSTLFSIGLQPRRQQRPHAAKRK